jgi:N-acetylglucosaminyl-diphospho-decaprenol L-rhamnosyltransferase
MSELLPVLLPVTAGEPPGPAAHPVLQTPLLSVVLVNYHSWQQTANLVRRLLTSDVAGSGEAEVMIVDNASPWHPVVPRLRRWPGVSLRRWGRNRGFGRAVNEGCRLSRGRWLLLLNPDMSVPADFLDGVMAVAGSLPDDAGIVGFQLRHDDGSLQLSTGRFPTLASTLLGLVLPRSRRKYQALPLDRSTKVDWVTGCCLLIRRECLEQLGGFDRSFFLYYEDVDLCKRAAALGWSVWFEPALMALHYRPLHVRRVGAPLRLITRHSLLTYASRHWPAWQFRLLAGVVRLEAVLRQTWAGCRGQSGDVGVYAELCKIAADQARGRQRGARRRLAAVVREMEEQGAAEPVDRDPKSPPRRSAACVPGKRRPARAAGDRGAGG